MRANPYKIVEGALIAAFAVGAREIVIAAKHSFSTEIARLRRAIEEVRTTGWAPEIEIMLAEGPSEYLFGEETALLEVIEGRRPFPRIAPPYRRGIDVVYEEGTNAANDIALVAPGETVEPAALVDNAETIANIPAILAEGADWFRSLGTPGSPGTIVCTITGRCARAGVGEVPMGTTLREAIELIGLGPRRGRHLVAAMSGVANPVVPERLFDTPLTYEAMAGIGSGLGAGGFIVFDNHTDLAAVAWAASRFLAVESCGQCSPCKRDGLAIAHYLRDACGPDPEGNEIAKVRDRLDTVARGARCYLASQQERVVRGFLDAFPDAFDATRRAAAGLDSTEYAPTIVPLVDIVDGDAVLDLRELDKQPDWTFDEVDSGRWPAEDTVPQAQSL
jgi:NADH:ubiquinone oxidoreductase subunit F (NADH-binding)